MDRNFYASGPGVTLLGDERAQQSPYDSGNMTDIQDLLTPYVDEGSRWAHAHTSTAGYDFFHPMPITTGYPSIVIPATIASNYQQPFITSDLQYSHIPAISYQQPMYNTSTYQPSLALMQAGSSPSTASYYSPSNPPIPGSTIPNTPFLNTPATSLPSTSRSPSPSSLSSRAHPCNDLTSYGHLNPETGAWTCAYPHCSSKAIFIRPCDLRKHFNRHNKNFYCRYEACAQNHEAGFSSKKDRLRHESKHNPGVQCEWDACERVFSRVDNMRNHMARSECLSSSPLIPAPPSAGANSLGWLLFGSIVLTELQKFISSRNTLDHFQDDGQLIFHMVSRLGGLVRSELK